MRTLRSFAAFRMTGSRGYGNLPRVESSGCSALIVEMRRWPGNFGQPPDWSNFPDERLAEEFTTMKCPTCGATLIAKPVLGAKQYPRRLECPQHGWQQEKLRSIRMRFHKDRPNL